MLFATTKRHPHRQHFCLLVVIAVFFLVGCSTNPEYPAYSYESPPELLKHYTIKQRLFMHRIELDTAMSNARNQPSESSIAEANNRMAAFRQYLNTFPPLITAAEGYLSRHPSEYESDNLAESKRSYEESRASFEIKCKEFQPTLAEFAVEKKRSEARRDKRKQLVMDFVRIKQIPTKSVLDDSNSVFYVEGAAIIDGKMVIHSHLEFMPDHKQNGAIEVHASINGQSLGHAVEKQLIADGKRWEYRTVSKL